MYRGLHILSSVVCTAIWFEDNLWRVKTATDREHVILVWDQSGRELQKVDSLTYCNQISDISN
jgi:hypothetical protein